MKVHAEIEYKDIHSDICPANCDFNNIDDTFRKILHNALDEWIDHSKGIGGFYIKNKDHQF